MITNATVLRECLDLPRPEKRCVTGKPANRRGLWKKEEKRPTSAKKSDGLSRL